MRKRLLVLAVVILFLISIASADEYPGQVYGPYFVGSKIYIGTGAPGSFGLNGDMYLDQSSGMWYNMTSTTWQALFTMLSPVPIFAAINANRTGATNDAIIAANANETSILNNAILAANANTSSTAPAVLAATPLITGNRTGAANDAILAANSNDTSTLNQGILAHVKNDTVLLRTVDDHITSNISASDDRMRTNETLAVKTATDLMRQNATILEGMISTNSSTATILAAADAHLTTNLSVISTWISENRSVALRTSDDHLSQNISASDDRIRNNETLVVKTATDLMRQNATLLEGMISTNSTAAGILSTMDSHMTTNLSAISIWIVQNISAVDDRIRTNETLAVKTATDLMRQNVTTERDLSTQNQSLSDDRMRTNETLAVKTATDLMRQNATILEGMISTNLSAATNLRAADDHISSNISASDDRMRTNETLAVKTATDLMRQNITLLEGQEASNNTMLLTATQSNRTLWANVTIPASSWIPDSLNGANITAPNATAWTIGPQTRVAMEFPKTGSIQYNASVEIRAPSYWTGGVVSFDVDWYETASSGATVWNLTGACEGDGTAMNLRFNMSPATVTDTASASLTNYISPISSTVTLPNGAASAMCDLQLGRNGGSGSDTLTVSAFMRAVRIYFPSY